MWYIVNSGFMSVPTRKKPAPSGSAIKVEESQPNAGGCKFTALHKEGKKGHGAGSTAAGAVSRNFPFIMLSTPQR